MTLCIILDKLKSMSVGAAYQSFFNEFALFTSLTERNFIA